MKADLSRQTFNPSKHFSSVRLQQGKVTLDAEWNEAFDIIVHRDDLTARDLIGQCGAPAENAGFAIKAKDGSIEIGAGRFYAKGIQLENEAPVHFDHQPYWPGAALPSQNGVYLAYVEARRRLIDSIDDPSLKEKALGGVETAVRVQTQWQVKFLPVQSPPPGFNCHTPLPAWDQLTSANLPRLTARAQPPEPATEACVIPANAGYRRLENQFYRVEIHAPAGTGAASFKWSRDNGAIVSRWIGQNGNELTVEDPGPDAVRGFAPGQWIELIDSHQELRGEPGTLVRIANVAGDTLTIDPDSATGPVSFVSVEGTPKVRRWDSVGLIQTDTTETDADGFISLEDGVQVRFSPGDYQTGQYWTIPARTIDNDVEWLRDPSGTPLALEPEGPHSVFCRLAILQKTGNSWEVLRDCRPIFRPLTSQLHCHSWIVGDGKHSIGQLSSIQEAIDRIGPEGGSILVLAGVYEEAVSIVGKRHLTIEGCGGRTFLRTGRKPLPALVNIRDSVDIELRGLRLEPDGNQLAVSTGEATRDQPPVQNLRLESLTMRSGASGAATLGNVSDLLVRDCRIQLVGKGSKYAALRISGINLRVESNDIGSVSIDRYNRRELSRLEALNPDFGGIQVVGPSKDVVIARNRIVGGAGRGITLGGMLTFTRERHQDETPSEKWESDHNAIEMLPENQKKQTPQEQPANMQMTYGNKAQALLYRARLEEKEGSIERTLKPSGYLHNIVIRENHIEGMGLSAIGIPEYFDHSQGSNVQAINNLTIEANRMHFCLRRPVATVENIKIRKTVAYGVVALSDIERLIIRGNRIEGNGQHIAQSNVAGIYIQTATAVVITDNRIVDNGAPAVESGEHAGGIAGGIVFVLIRGPVRMQQALRGIIQELPTGEPALLMSDNVVVSPRGPAVAGALLGTASICGNQFISQSQDLYAGGFSAIGRTVVLTNLGMHPILRQLLLTFLDVFKNPDSTSALARFELAEEVRMDELLAFRGSMLFDQNQCDFHGGHERESIMMSSVTLLSLDDLSFSGNQSVVQVDQQARGFTNFLGFGITQRCIGNLFSEPHARFLLSGVSFGLINNCALNISTHCLIALDGGSVVSEPSNKSEVERMTRGSCQFAYQNPDQPEHGNTFHSVAETNQKKVIALPPPNQVAYVLHSADMENEEAVEFAKIQKSARVENIRISEAVSTPELRNEFPFQKELEMAVVSRQQYTLLADRIKMHSQVERTIDTGKVDAGSIITGTVIETDLEAIHGAKVSIVDAKGKELAGLSKIETDEEGHFKIELDKAAESKIAKEGATIRISDHSDKVLSEQTFKVEKNTQVHIEAIVDSPKKGTTPVIESAIPSVRILSGLR